MLWSPEADKAVLGWWNATFWDDRECSVAAQSKSEDRDKTHFKVQNGRWSLRNGRWSVRSRWSRAMYARVCASCARVCSRTLQSSRKGLQKQTQNIQPISKKIPKLFQTSSETCPPRPACRDFRKACSPPHPGVARTTPEIVGIS